MASFRDPSRPRPPGRDDDAWRDAEPGRRGRDARDDADDFTRELSDRYGHGQGGYDRSAYPQGGHGEAGGEAAMRRERRDGREDREFSPRRSYREPGYHEPWDGDDHVSTGIFGGGMDQSFRSGGQYQGESGHGAQPGHRGDFSGGGYLGHGTTSRPRHEARSGGAFGESPRGWRGPGDGDPGGYGRDVGRAGAGHRGRGPKNYTRADQRIVEDVCERLTEDDYIDAGDIEVQVSEGVVTLTGSVGTRSMKHRAEDVAEACGGVRDVENRIRVSRQDGLRGGLDAAGA